MASRQLSTRTSDPVLAAAAEAAQAEQRAAAQKFLLAATWAEQHPAPAETDVVDALGELVMYGDQPVSIAGEGAPGMSEFAIAEFAAAIGVSTLSGRRLISAAVECRHRLPKIWARVMAGEVPTWKARRVTEHTHRLPMAAAATVDAELAPVLHACSLAQVERAASTATAQVDDEHVEAYRVERWQAQHLDIDLADAALNGGLVPVSGLLDYTDAVALDAAIRERAHALRDDYPELDLDLRRAMALGRLADAASSGQGREVVVFAHLDPAAPDRMVQVEGLGVTTLEQLHEWCRYNATRVTIRPVLDLAEELSAPGYQPTTRQREQAILTNPTCVFPHCTVGARRCDLDHIDPYEAGGPTSSSNLAPLCRGHHRLKTHGGWSYRRLGPTQFKWTSPSGRGYTVESLHRRRAS